MVCRSTTRAATARVINQTTGSGGGAAGATPLLLDTYSSAFVAFSLRKLSNDYLGAACRVRRDSDSAEQDIGFSGNALDASSLASFCSGANGFIAKWYDQSGNTRDAVQAVAASQPKIYDSSTGTILRNSLPAIDFDGTDDHIDLGYLFAQPFTFSFVGYISAATQYILGCNLKPSLYMSGTSPRIFADAAYTGAALASAYYHRVDRFDASNTVANITHNGSQEDFTAGATYTPSNLSAIGSSREVASSTFLNDMQELIFWNSYQGDTAKAGIEENVNVYYGIYS